MLDEKNKLILSADFVNRDLRERILRAAHPYLKDYQVQFHGGFVTLTARLEVKTLGELTAYYQLKIEELKFHSKAHTLHVSYQEDVKSNGNLTQTLMLKAVGLKSGTFLQTILGMAPVKGVIANQKSCSIDLEQLVDLKRPFLSELALTYLDSRDDTLILSYGLQ